MPKPILKNLVCPEKRDATYESRIKGSPETESIPNSYPRKECGAEPRVGRPGFSHTEAQKHNDEI